MTKAESFYDRYKAAGDEEGRCETLSDAILEAVAAYIDGKPSPRRDDLMNALLNNEQLKLVFSDLSFLELVPLSREGLFVGWGPQPRDTERQ
jgi:hypothetical protein